MSSRILYLPKHANKIRKILLHCSFIHCSFITSSIWHQNYQIAFTETICKGNFFKICFCFWYSLIYLFQKICDPWCTPTVIQWQNRKRSKGTNVMGEQKAPRGMRPFWLRWNVNSERTPNPFAQFIKQIWLFLFRKVGRTFLTGLVIFHGSLPNSSCQILSKI